MTTLGYFLAYQVSGADPFGFMFLKFFVHFTGAAFLFAVCGLLFKDRFWAAAAAAVYFLRMVDPVFEGMALLPDILAACLSLAALWSYLRMAGARSYSARWCALTCALTLGAVLAKEMSVLLPGVFLSHKILFPEYCPQRSGKRFWKEHGPIWVVMGLYLAGLKWWIVAETFYGPVEWVLPASLSWSAGRFAEYFRSFYSGPMFFPFGGLVLLAALFVFSFWERSKIKETGRFFAFAMAWAALALIPVLNIFPLPRFQTYFDLGMVPRYLAFAGAAMACLLGYLGHLCGRRRWLRVLLGGLVAVGVARGTYVKASLCADWRGGLDRAFGDAWSGHDAFPARALLSYPLILGADPGYALKIRGQLLEIFSERQVESILDYFGDDSIYFDEWKTKHVPGMFSERNPLGFMKSIDAEALFARGMGRLREGSVVLAGKDFKRTVEMDSRHTLSCFMIIKAHRSASKDLGLILFPDACWSLLLGEGGSGHSVLREGHASLMRAKTQAEGMVREGRYEEARAAYERIIARAYLFWPETGPVLMELSLLRGGAREQFDLALKAFAFGDHEGAIAGFDRAIQVKPDYAEAFVSRGVLLSMAGAGERALSDFDKALGHSRHRGLRAHVLSARADSLEKLGRSEEARADRLRARQEKNLQFGRR